MSGKTQIDIVHVLGWMGNLSRTLVIRREIGRFKNRETKPSWGLLIRSVFSQAAICLAALFCNVVARTFIIGGDDGIGKPEVYVPAEKSLVGPGLFDRIVRLIGGRGRDFGLG